MHSTKKWAPELNLFLSVRSDELALIGGWRVADLGEAFQHEQAVDLATPTAIVNVLEEVCAAAGFGPSTPQRDDVANCLANLYSDGYFTVEVSGKPLSRTSSVKSVG